MKFSISITYHTIMFHISIKTNGSVSAIKVKCDIWKICPSLLLKLFGNAKIQKITYTIRKPKAPSWQEKVAFILILMIVQGGCIN